MTDYLGILNRFEPEGAIADWDGLFSSWTTDRTGGFSDEEIAGLLKVLPGLAMAMKATTLARMASTLLETYLGRDACNSVWSGRIARGVADRSTRCCGSATCAATPASATMRRRSRSSRC